MRGVIVWFVSCFLVMVGCAKGTTAGTGAGPGSGAGTQKSEAPAPLPDSDRGLEKATFAGGCFWCVDAAFEDLEGVKEIVSGFTGGHVKNPTYEQVGKGETGHLEAIQVIFDPAIISYAELLRVYWRQFDPTDDGGSFHDRGPEYVSAIFYHDETQKALAEASRTLLAKSGLFGKPIVTKILRFEVFYQAEEYHQHYCRKSTDSYHSYRTASGRDNYIGSVWGKNRWSEFQKPSDVELKKTLLPLEFTVTQMSGTERSFDNAYWNNEQEGLYVDRVSGEPLFSSRDKFDSGTGWPSFTAPVDPRFVRKKVDRSPSEEQIEVRSRYSDSHLGHVFDDGPAPGHLRYCMNSASLRFIPKAKLQSEGYGDYTWLFNK